VLIAAGTNGKGQTFKAILQFTQDLLLCCPIPLLWIALFPKLEVIRHLISHLLGSRVGRLLGRADRFRMLPNVAAPVFAMDILFIAIAVLVIGFEFAITALLTFLRFTRNSINPGFTHVQHVIVIQTTIDDVATRKIAG
jgi:hypothetical protein